MKKTLLDQALEEALNTHKINIATHKYPLPKLLATNASDVIPRIPQIIKPETRFSAISLTNNSNLSLECIECTGNECKFKRRLNKSKTIVNNAETSGPN